MHWLGQWRNQNGSILTIDQVVGSHIVGTFISKKGRAVKGETYPVQGTVNDELIGFVVDFGSVGSLVNFSGRLAEDGSLHTLWILARNFADDEKTRKSQPWNSFIVNSDVFERIGTAD